ncbi:MAG: winged helix-turn-helix transcriptional regulator [Rhodospirillales bacterium]|nr:winged helix-turn-helix transcriptional regulator [Rhodospirillales bacterium]
MTAADQGQGPSVGDYALEDQIGYVLRKAHQRATAVFLARFGEPELTPTQWAALVKLSDTGGASQNQLGRMTAMDPATIQGVVRRLEERHLIERASDPEDRRRSMLKLTPPGEALVGRLRGDAHAVSRAILEPLSGEERQTLLRLLGAIS